MTKTTRTDVDWIDVGLHAALAVVMAQALYWSGLAGGGWQAALLATLALYLREVTQVQSRYYGNHFFRGWLTDLHHTAEWLVPGLVAFAVMGWR